MNDTGLVLEGGGMRGLYTAGVLEYFAQHDIHFPYIIGVSAGACMAASYLSEQQGRNRTVSIDFVNDKRYLSFSNFIRKGELFGMDFIFDEIPNNIVPLDVKKIINGPDEFVVVTTNCETGEPMYFYKEDYDEKTLGKLLRASSSIPFFADAVEHKGRYMLDGGIVDPLPIIKAESDGYAKNVVVLTKPKGYYKKQSRMSTMINYKKYPKVDERMKVRYKHYNERLDYIFEQEKTGNIIVIAPSEDSGVGRTTRNKEKLENLYELGYKDTAEKFEAVKSLMNV
ncbi:patatin family protein [Jeotgalicoccus coquinae]|uniref:NTE family protein RssA n=1 Tax=Jeotgalicoccus coquinae TaxID=709509 RepID=A0A6V7RS60_9STAP|nr:patatin family protein [Jeotgalicoccus coquinae]MBB6423242.1 putative patatin/cPLA2 family phospholipase [Jeotgalicoccus coquinae]GGE09553.1 patatin family protein [Jeotgalicoccus coquinae]CAD2081901.1 NTE family protein RssA [Jeotgalicoccus coquinae]